VLQCPKIFRTSPIKRRSGLEIVRDKSLVITSDRTLVPPLNRMSNSGLPNNPSSRSSPSEGLKLARFMMVLSSLSPLFFLWAVRGITCIEDRWLWLICSALIIIPNAMLLWRIRIAKLRNDVRTLTVGHAEDHREYLLVYLFAMLIPLYDVNLGSTRDAAAAAVALLFIVFLFWHLNLHYMNVLFAVRGYRVFTITPGEQDFASGEPFVLLTKRIALHQGQKIRAYRLSNTVFFEPKERL
jgi:hypothetical protein